MAIDFPSPPQADGAQYTDPTSGVTYIYSVDNNSWSFKPATTSVRGSLTPELRTSSDQAVSLNSNSYMYYVLQDSVCTLLAKVEAESNLTESDHYKLINLPESIIPSPSLNDLQSLGTATITNNDKATVFAVTVSAVDNRIRIYMTPDQDMSSSTSFTLQATYPVGSF